MSGRNKLQKFSDLVGFKNVFEYSEAGFESNCVFNGEKDIKIQGNWNKEHFKNDNPIVLELACGRGEYTCALAEMYPDKNFIGVDVKGARIWQGATKTIENNPNAAFLRIRIEHIAYFFSKGEVDEIWITFPDPFLNERKANRRLTSPEFLERYTRLLKNDGIIHLKTDDPVLYQFTVNTIQESPLATMIENNPDIYASSEISEELEIKTYYEGRNISNSNSIKYVQFSLTTG